MMVDRTSVHGLDHVRRWRHVRHPSHKRSMRSLLLLLLRQDAFGHTGIDKSTHDNRGCVGVWIVSWHHVVRRWRCVGIGLWVRHRWDLTLCCSGESHGRHGHVGVQDGCWGVWHHGRFGIRYRWSRCCVLSPPLGVAFFRSGRFHLASFPLHFNTSNQIRTVGVGAFIPHHKECAAYLLQQLNNVRPVLASGMDLKKHSPDLQMSQSQIHGSDVCRDQTSPPNPRACRIGKRTP